MRADDPTMDKRLTALRTISPEFVAQVCERLDAGRAVRRTLPGGGRLHMDRALPFLCLYRDPSGKHVGHPSQLVIGEAAHLIAPGTSDLHDSLRALIRGIADVMVKKFGAFLLLEVWTAEDRVPDGSPVAKPSTRQVPTPTFRVFTPYLPDDDPSVRQLHKSLSNIPLRPPPLDVEIVSGVPVAPPSLRSLLTDVPRTQSSAGAAPTDAPPSAMVRHYIGIEVQPVYRQARTGTPYPMLFEVLRRGLSVAIRQTAYHFALLHTAHEPGHFHALGRRTSVRATNAVDRELTTIARSFDFLLQVTPANADRARVAFDRSAQQRDPEFDYRPLIVDVPLLKRRLYELPIERLEDPTLAHLMAASRDELDRKLTMLADRNTPRFIYGSLSVYGSVSDGLRDVALTLLSTTSSDFDDEDDPESVDVSMVNATAFARLAKAELALYREYYDGLSTTVTIREDISGLIVSDGHLLIGSRFNATPMRAMALLQHEIGTHVVTHSNGLAQPLGLLATGLAGYEETQEGLAVAAEYMTGALSPSRVRVLAARVIAVRAMTDGATFIDCHRTLVQQFGFATSTAFTICMRVFRSGGLTKDAIYLRGLIDLLRYLGEGRDLEPLLLGKLALADVPALEELRWRQYLKPPRLTPRFLTNPGAADAMQRLRRGHPLPDLLTGIAT